jgi:hypothetical protein
MIQRRGILSSLPNALTRKTLQIFCVSLFSTSVLIVRRPAESDACVRDGKRPRRELRCLQSESRNSYRTAQTGVFQRLGPQQFKRKAARLQGAHS